MKRIGVAGIPGAWSTEQLLDAVEVKTGFRLLIDMSRVRVDLDSRRVYQGETDLTELDAIIVKKIAPSYYTHNSIHVITPFDSGGSSAVIRKAFGMLAVGDIRNRIMALADKSVRGNPNIFELFAHRLPRDASSEALEETLSSFVYGRHLLIRQVPNPMRQIIRSQLRLFAAHMPRGFDLRNACIGNLILTGGFLGFDRHIDPVVYMFSRLVEARGDVCAVSNKDLHLMSVLEDGTRLIGQHLITGKEQPLLR